MQRNSDDDIAVGPTWLADDLGRWIRWSLEDAVADAEPPSSMWGKISTRINELEEPAHRRPFPDIASFPWSQLLQTVVASTLLLAFVLGLENRASEPHSLTPSALVLDIQPTATSVESPQDMLSSRMRFQLERDALSQRASSGEDEESIPKSGASQPIGSRRGIVWKDVELPE